MIEPNWIWGVVEIAILVALSLLGVHLFVVLGVVSSVFAILFYGDLRGVSLIGTTVLSRTFSYSMSMLPLFILMGVWVEVAGLGKDAYDAAVKWLVKVKAGLAMIAIYAQALFGTVTGLSAASIATIGGISLPEMRRHGYSATLRTGAVASASVLANLIPPSMMAVLYSIFTEESVGKLFIAGLIPGIILTFLYAAVVYIWATLRPSDAPPLPRDVSFTWGEKFKSLFSVMPVIIIFLVLIGGIYLGWFSPTEAAGIGASTVLIVTLAYRRMGWHNFNRALNSTLRLSAYMFFVLGPAFVFAHTIVMSGIGNAIAEAITGAGVSYIVLIYLISLVFIIAGMFLNLYALFILFLPIFYPVVTGLPGAPPMAGIWFGTLSVVLAELGLLTPPIAGSIYITQLIDGCLTKDVVKGVIPFYSVIVILIVLIIQFPWLSTWLPSTMIGG